MEKLSAQRRRDLETSHGNRPEAPPFQHQVNTRLSTLRQKHTNRRLMAQRVSGSWRGVCLCNEALLLCAVARSRQRSPAQALLSLVTLATFVAGSGCGFGTYNDSAAPQVTSATSGVADAGQWWPWACPDGDNPSPASAPLDYTASGSCGDGGAFTLSVNGCEIFGTWSVLGLSDVQTLQPTSTPSLGGWIVSATPSAADAGVTVGDGGTEPWSCEATPSADGGLTFTCSDAISSATICQSTLTPVGEH